MVDWRLWSFFTIAVGRLSASSNVVGDCNPKTSNDVPLERANFSQLLAVNPNYFGNAPNSDLDPVFPLANNISYEELKCVGFNSILNHLSATIEVKLPFGFDGGLCTNGSYEYVRFWVDYGTGWSNIGYVSVNTHDILNGTDCKKAPDLPLFYTLSLAFTPESKNCSIPVFPSIRTVLSWNEIPSATDPNWQPTWGNHIDQHIQSALNHSSVAQLQEAVVHYPGDFIANNICNYPEVDELFKSTARGGSAISPLANDQKPFHGDPQLMAGDTSWEELTCLGLDYSLNSLVATVKIKKPQGFGTDPCHNGSTEYVSFWADWNNTCNYTFLGTQMINIHNFDKLPADGLSYTAIMPVDTNSGRSFCNKTKIGRVRAALSWNVPPPEPPTLPVFGNILEAHVQLQPYTTPPGIGGDIEVIGDVFISQIDTSLTGMTLPGAHYAFQPGDQTDRTLNSRKCPFGGWIRINSLSDPPPNTVYRIMARSAPFISGDDGTPLADPVSVAIPTAVPPASPTGTNKAGPDGYFNYLPRNQNFWGDLASWTPKFDGLWQIRLETATKVGHNHIAYTPWYNIRVNNERPTGNILFTTGGICSELFIGQTLTGVFYATMANPEFFDEYDLNVHPGGLIPHPVIPSSGTSVVQPDNSIDKNPITPWSLDTHNATACGYIVQLHARALTVYSSDPGSPIELYIDRGFCLRNPKSEPKH